mgnify:CR=1 FL=1
MALLSGSLWLCTECTVLMSHVMACLCLQCPRWWPLPNITVTGAETCGMVSQSFKLTLPYLNTVNGNRCE